MRVRALAWAATGLIVAGIAGAAVWRMETTRQDVAPPAEVVEPATCPFEGCQLGQWTARRDVPVYDAAGGTVRSVVRGGDTVTAIAQQVRAIPRRARVVMAHQSDVEQGMHVGDIVYALFPIGEGAVAVWHGGEVIRGSLDLVLQYDEPLEPGGLQWTWWVNVRLGDGTTGWFKNPQGAFDGMDAHA